MQKMAWSALRKYEEKLPMKAGFAQKIRGTHNRLG
jgi:hypothetical protein